MLKAAGGFGSRWMTDLINNIVKGGCIPDDGRKGILVPVYKGKGDPLVCGSYIAIKLLEQPIKVFESVGKEGQVSIDYMQFGFMPGKGTTDATSTRETPSKEEEDVLCFCGFREEFDKSPKRGGEMGFEEAGCR